jgi:hypothetical protein
MRVRCALTALLLLLASAALPQEAPLRLEPGTRIKLRVQRTLSTQPKGGVLGLIGVKPQTREDTLVIYEVAEDVFDPNGILVIPAGSPATGTVVDSQVGGGFKPHAPRLAATVDRALTAEGTFVPLRFDSRHEGRWAHVFGRQETGAFVRQVSSGALDKLMSRPENSDAIRELFELVIHGNVGEMFRHPEKALRLRYVADHSGMPTLARYLQDGRIFQLASLVAEIQTGAFVLHGIADVGHLMDAFRLVDDTWKAGNQLLTWAYGRVKAPQIVVPAGFPVEAVVADVSGR